MSLTPRIRWTQSYCRNLAGAAFSAFVRTTGKPSRYLLDWMIARGWCRRAWPSHSEICSTYRQPRLRRVARPETRNEIVFLPAGNAQGHGPVLRRTRPAGPYNRPQHRAGDFLGKFSRIGAAHTGVYIAERAKRWRAAPRIIAVFDQKEALDYLRRPASSRSFHRARKLALRGC